MTNGTCKQVVVSTLAEAQFYSENGFSDITYAYPLSIDKVKRSAEFVNKLELFHITVDNMKIIKALGEYTLPPKKKWSVLLMVDCGSGRGEFSNLVQVYLVSLHLSKSVILIVQNKND